MTIEVLRETAAMAHLNPAEDSLAGIFPAFAEMLEFFDTMQAADGDRAAFPDGLASVSPALSGAAGNVVERHAAFYQLGEDAASSRDARPESFWAARPKLFWAASSGLNETLLNNAGERDGRFLVIPNVL
jgi:aspartyl-tRNA(Asn)/glutamyl-tRNA(Gln) amidotransferase subunit C